MVLLIDNYDSFSYNLYQLIGELLDGKKEIKVIRNDAHTVDEIVAMNPTHIVISPGPGYPKDAGIIEDVVRECNGKIPILGVCLGHQAICEALGAAITHAGQLMHGKKDDMKIIGDCPIFAGLGDTIGVARYHSLVANESTLPDNLIITGKTTDGEVMAVMDKNQMTFGLQFHPESIMTIDGATIMKNFLNI